MVSKGLPPVDRAQPGRRLHRQRARTSCSELNLEYDAERRGVRQARCRPARSSARTRPQARASRRVSTVSVVVSLGPPLVEVPNVLDMPLEEAIAELEAAGFDVRDLRPVRRQPAQPRRHAGPRGWHPGPQGQRRRARTRLMASRSKKASTCSADRRARPDQRRPGQARPRVRRRGRRRVRAGLRHQPARLGAFQGRPAAGRRVPRGRHRRGCPAYVHASFLINLGTP